MITREQFENSYIVNDHGELREKYLEFAKEGGGIHGDGTYGYPILFVSGTRKVESWSNIKRFLVSDFFEENKPKQLTLADFEEDEKEKEEMETPAIDWSQALEGYDYWIEYPGNEPEFHKLTSDGTQYVDHVGFHYSTEPDKDLIVYKRPEQVTVLQYKYTPIEVESVFDLKDHLVEGKLHYKVKSSYHKISNEWSMMESIIGDTQIYLREVQTWQDVAQEFIKNDPVLSEYEFVGDMFGNECKEYHEPLKQLAKLIVENIK